MYKLVDAAPENTSPVITGIRFFPNALGADAINERDRRDFEDSLRAQAARVNQTATRRIS